MAKGLRHIYLDALTRIVAAAAKAAEAEYDNKDNDKPGTAVVAKNTVIAAHIVSSRKDVTLLGSLYTIPRGKKCSSVTAAVEAAEAEDDDENNNKPGAVVATKDTVIAAHI
ncbi:hypothetical protein IZU99_02165 [Oscillospiraceae bacterium CM]|nr:hypothetical protein IZU99_02165 [Oscillospiraceae bacterium CM]